MSRAAGVLTPGFAAPVHDAQRVFRAVLDAMARPLQPQALEVPLAPPAPLSAEMGAVVLALCDDQTPLWCDGALREVDGVEAWIRFHTGARFVDDPGEALFCLASRPSAVPQFEKLNHGTDEEPHLSATVIVDAADRGAPCSSAADSGCSSFTAGGPGIRTKSNWDGAGLPVEFLRTRNASADDFPRGVDVLIARVGTVVGLPRTTVLVPVDPSEHALQGGT